MKIIYWSGTGKTEKMANLIASGIGEEEKTAEVINVANADASMIEDEDVIVLGCSAMGDEVLEECEFEPFIESIEGKLSGKKVALFGSYGWGSGKWMEDWEARMIAAGAISSIDPIIVCGEPSGDSETECIEFGRKIAKL